MLAFGVFEILILLFVFGVGAGVITLFANATGNGKVAAFVLIGALTFIALLVGFGVVFLYATARAPQHVAAQVTEMQVSADGAPQLTFTPDLSYVGVGSSGGGWTQHYSSSRISFFGIFVGIGLIAVIISAIRRRACGGGTVRWPVYIVLGFVAMLFLTRLGFRSYVSHSSFDQARANAEQMMAKQRDIIAEQRAKIEGTIAQQNAKMEGVAAQQQAKLAAVQQPNMSIDDLEHLFDGPRIPVAPAPDSAEPDPFDNTANDDKPVSAELVSEKTAADATPAVDSNSEKKDPPEAKSEASKDESKAASGASTTGADDESKAETQKRSKKKKNDEKTAVAAVPPAKVAEPPTSPESVKPPEAAAITAPATSNARPAWVDQPAKDIGDVQRDKIVTDEYSSEEECRRARDVALMVKTQRHLCDLVGLPHDEVEVVVNGSTISNWNISDFRYRQLADMGVSVDYVRREVATDEYLEKTERSVGPMLRLHTLVAFSPAVDRELLNRWQAYRRQERFAVIGIGAFSVLGLLSMVWGVLKVDTLTKGYYTKRLFFGVPLAILGLLGFYVMLVEMGFKLPH